MAGSGASSDELPLAHVAATTEARLRAAGLTRQKAAYCHTIARTLRAGTLDLAAIAQLSDEAVRAILLQLPGVGPWTADIYLLMALLRPDVWPQGDLALARAAQQVKRIRRLPNSEQLAHLAAAWAPWRAVAARILWHSYISNGRQGVVRRTEARSGDE